MPIELPCPVCGATVALLRDGYVTQHPGKDGEPCRFRRTASAPGHQKIADRSSEERAAHAARLKKVRERDRAKVAEIAGGGSGRGTKAKQAKAPKPQRAECPRCGKKVVESRKSATGLAAHQRPSGRWCKGGAEPTPAQRERGYATRSVRTVGGGLPGLGKR